MKTACVDSAVLLDWRQALVRQDKINGNHFSELVEEIDRKVLVNPDQTGLPEFVDLLERIGSAAPTAGLAWSTGQATKSFYDCEFGRAIAGCKTLGTALHWFAHFVALVQDATSVKLEVAEDWTTLSYKILDPNVWPRHEDALYSLGIMSKLIKAAAPEAWGHVKVTLEAEQKFVRPDLANVIQARVFCGGTTNSIRFPSAILEAPLRLAPSSDASVLKRMTGELTKKHRATPISERTRQLIYNEMNDGCVSQEHIARELGVSGRTLRRRLSAEGTSFQSLLDSCRMQFAAHEFRTRDRLSLSEMALRLGYSEHSTFSRAFARWSGMAPQEYRRTVAVH